MNLDAIQAFLAVVDLGSISQAATSLYTTQGSISKKLKALEEEVGVTLLVRHKGIHQVELTSYGQTFLHTARQMDLLRQDMETIHLTEEKKYLSIGAVDTITLTILNEFVHDFMKRHPEICLSIHSYHSSQVYSKLNDHFIDLGYAQLIREQYADIHYETILSSPIVAITANNTALHENMSIKQLNPSKEIYIRRNEEFEHWHNHHFGNKQYFMRVGTDILMREYLDFPDTWAFIGEYSAKSLSKKYGYHYYHLQDIPQHSEVYEVEHAYTRISRLPQVELFKNELRAYLQQMNTNP